MADRMSQCYDGPMAGFLSKLVLPIAVGAVAFVLLLGLIFNVLNFENGLGWISLSAYWQSVVRGVFLMVVVMAGSGAARRAVRAADPD